MHAHPALAGLTITYALQVTGFLNWVVRMGTQVEAQMNAGACLGRPAAQALPKLLLTPLNGCMAGMGGVPVERILFYTKVENERPWIIEDRRPPANWPVKPTIVMVRD